MRWPCYFIIFNLFFAAFSGNAMNHYSNLIIFGDSLSDVGNNTWIDVKGRDQHYSQGAPITNIDFSAQQPLIWPQYLVKSGQFTEKTVIPSRLWTNQDLQTTNIDYAYASAETGDGFVNDLVSPFTVNNNCLKPGKINHSMSCVPGVGQQISYYLADLHQHKQEAGKQTLFIIWAGGNDIYDNVGRLIYRAQHFRSNPWLLFSSRKYQLSWTPAYNLYRATQRLMAAGVPANHIIIFNLVDLSKVPGTLSVAKELFPNSKYAIRSFLSVFHGVTTLFNMNLSLWFHLGIRAEEKPQLFDIDNIFVIMASGNRFLGYSFANVKNSCVRQQATPYCRGYLFFNDKHPTTKAGSLLAQMIVANI
jgi:phospholipase/lecithinase/hemolysin